MRKERMNNKGFSLVELIIVIAIMAILAAALAPQLMKYIEKSRVSTDSTSCASIESSVSAALANEEAYKQIASKATGTGDTSKFEFRCGVNETTGEVEFSGNVQAADVSEFYKEIKDSLSSLKAPKQTGMKSYQVEIFVEKGTAAIAAGGTSTVYNVGKIRVQTVQTEV